MEKNSNIIEIFSSVQGEGPYVGCRQIFIRFSGCNLACKYCDTQFEPQEYCNVEINSNKDKFKKIQNPVSGSSLLSEIAGLTINKPHSVSLTGGEPLLNYEFLAEFLAEFKRNYPEIKVYLETNGTLWNELEKIILYIDIISMDLKLQSSTGEKFPFAEHKSFIETALKYNKEIFAKAVFAEKISDEEIFEIAELLNIFEKKISLVLQPLTITLPDGNIKINSENLIGVQDKFLQYLTDVRMIPQMHRFLNLL